MMPPSVIGESLVLLKLTWRSKLGMCIFVDNNRYISILMNLFRGQVFPIHPLDVNPSTAVDPTLCIGSFVPSSFNIGNDLYELSFLSVRMFD